MTRRMRQRIWNAWQKLLHEEATPNRIAMGFAIGLFTAFFPTMILDTLVALGMAYLARANRAACLVGNNFFLLIFPVIPFLFGTEYLIGRMLLCQSPSPSMPKHWNLGLLLYSQGANYHAMIVGAAVLAAPASLLSFVGVKVATTRWQGRSRGGCHIATEI